MNTVWRNRVALLGSVMLLMVLAVSALQSCGVYDVAQLLDPETPFDRLEESGFADVLHFDRVESRWASNMVIHVAAILYSPASDLSDAYVAIEDASYIVKRGGYEWKPDEQEPPDVKWSHWTVPKFRHYSDNALFPPGKGAPAQEAIKVLVGWQNDERTEVEDRAMQDWLYAVVQEACQYEDKWSWIEVDLFSVALQPTPTLIATKSGKPAWAAEYELIFTHTIFLYRRSPEDSDWTIDKLLDEGELTDEKIKWMFTTGQLQMHAALTPFGPILYDYEGYGFNHPWQGREIRR